jgi:hypothetical protein
MKQIWLGLILAAALGSAPAIAEGLPSIRVAFKHVVNFLKKPFKHKADVSPAETHTQISP